MKIQTSIRPRLRSPRWLPAVGCALGLALSGCEGSALVFYDSPDNDAYDEGEPNDEAWLASHFGGLSPGEGRLIDGWSTDDGSDPQDGLSFTAYGPCRIEFTLYVDNPFADLDVWLYDPEFDEFVAAFDGAYGDEKGEFYVDGHASDFHLVVFSAAGASHWTLDVYASPLYAASASASASAMATLPALGAETDSSPSAKPAPEHLDRYRAFRNPPVASPNRENPAGSEAAARAVERR